MKADTIAGYLDALSSLLVIENQDAWSPHLRAAPMRHVTDLSLAVAAQPATPQHLTGDPRFLDPLLEPMVMRALRIRAQAADARVFRYGEKGRAGGRCHRRNNRWVIVSLRHQVLAHGAERSRKTSGDGYGHTHKAGVTRIGEPGPSTPTRERNPVFRIGARRTRERHQPSWITPTGLAHKRQNFGEALVNVSQGALRILG